MVNSKQYCFAIDGYELDVTVSCVREDLVDRFMDEVVEPNIKLVLGFRRLSGFYRAKHRGYPHSNTTFFVYVDYERMKVYKNDGTRTPLNNYEIIGERLFERLTVIPEND